MARAPALFFRLELADAIVYKFTTAFVDFNFTFLFIDVGTFFFHPLSEGLASAEWLATNFFSLSFLPSSVSMANFSSSVATVFSRLFFFFRPSPKRSGSCLQS